MCPGVHPSQRGRGREVLALQAGNVGAGMNRDKLCRAARGPRLDADLGSGARTLGVELQSSQGP